MEPCQIPSTLAVVSPCRTSVRIVCVLIEGET
jgi:hypothetical protein